MTGQTRPLARSLPTIHVGLLALLAALLVLPLVLAPRAEAFVYWTDPMNNAIGRANLAGTGVDKRFISGVEIPGSVAVDARHIYWGGFVRVDGSLKAAIGRARLDGTKVDRTFIPDPVGPWSIERIAVDAHHIYWINDWTGAIGRANLDGSGVETGFITGFTEGTVSGLAVDANHIYWSQIPRLTQTAAIGRANVDGTGIDRGFIPFPSGFAPVAVEVDAAHIYWFNEPIDPSQWIENIGRANLDGTGVEQSFISGFGFAQGGASLAVDAAHVYWAGHAYRPPGGGPPTGLIGRSDPDGANVDQSFITPTASGVAVNFSVGKAKGDKEWGTAELTVEVPASGGIALAQTKKVKGAEVRADAAGEVQLAIKPRGKAKKKLAEHGKAKIKVEVTYTPDGGEPEAQIATLRLKR